MDNTIRILHVVVNMNRGGAETLIMNVYRSIDRSKFQFDFLVHKKQGDFEQEITELGGKIHRIPYVTEVGHFNYIRTLRCFFKEHPEYKIVHAHMDCMSGLVMGAAKGEKVPVRISHSHNTKSEGNAIVRAYKEYVRRRIIPNSTHLCACSESAAAWLFRKHSVNSLIVKNGIEIEKFLYSMEVRKKKRRELFIDDNALVIGHVGRFCHQKNHSFLIDVFSEVRRRVPGALLLLVGDGQLKADIMRKAQKMGLESSVVFLGVRTDIPELLQAMDVMLFPSYHEGLPVTILEAQASGLRCIVSDAVTSEADVGAGLITFFSLRNDAYAWASIIIDSIKVRENTEVYMRDKGFYITNTAKDLQNHYLNILTG